MNATDVVHCLLTVLFSVAAVRALRQGVRSPAGGCRDRVDHLLHAAMALAMAVMPWRLGGVLPALPQSVFFAAAALWFPWTAVRSGREGRLAATVRRLPYAVGMAAMTWMSYRAAGHQGHETMAGGLPADDDVTWVLALYLLICALRSLTRDMPALRATTGTAGDCAGPRSVYDNFWDGVTAMGTVVMLLMPH
ncbi:DUF5134 domain-containing protein [Streptomyces sp. NPDC086777]|uniref:DUF5134 domain-containing protein n=1 Tax=Streptomyces sp. NPDC086777 TaxID=3154866 RepID=UPI00344B039B